jgi:putative MATE family efflux protein
MSLRHLRNHLKNLRGDLDLTTGNLFAKIILFAVPVILTSLVQLLYTSADLLVVEYFGGGNYSMAAVGDNGSLINLIVNTFVGVSVGANVIMGIHKGQNDKEAATKTVSSSLIIAFCLGLLVAIIGFFGADTFLGWMNTPDGIRALAATYLRIYFLGVPFMMLFNFGAALLRAVGDSRRPLYALLLCGLLNVGLNFLFVVGFGMAGNGLDVAAVAITTVISEFFEAALVLRFLADRKNAFVSWRKKDLRPDLEESRKILKEGLPAGAEVFVFSISNVVIQGAANTLGASVVAGNTASDTVEGYLYCVLEAFAVAIASIVAQNYGANKKENLKKSLAYSLIIIAALGVVLGLLAALFREQLVGLFVQPSADPSFDYAAMEAGTSRLLLMGTLAFLCSMMDCLAGFLRGIKQAATPTLVTIICALLSRLVYVYVFFYRFEALQNIPALYAAYPASWLLACLAYAVLIPIYYRKASREIDSRLMPEGEGARA